MTRLSVLLLAGLITGPVHARPRSIEASSASVRNYVQRFYNWYLGPKHRDLPYLEALSQKRFPFSQTLLTALKRDWKMHSAGEEALNFDPFLNSQDPASRYVVTKVTHERARYHVTLRGIRGKGEEAGATVVAVISRASGGWRFDNFLYPTKIHYRDILSVLGSFHRQSAEDGHRGSRVSGRRDEAPHSN